MNLEIEIGNLAPSFKAIMTNAKSGNLECILEDFRGKYLLLYFYPKDNTPGCTIEAKDFNSLQEEFAHYKVEIIGISRDSIDSHKKFCDNYNLTINLISDQDESLCKAFGVLKEKSFFGKKYIAIERTTCLIDPEGKIVNIWRNVSALGHAKKILDYVKNLPNNQ
jgi:peroxiredoxin Q/BCP